MVILGLISGFINGVLGTGGGILIIFTLNYIFRKKNGKDNENKDLFKDNIIITLASIIPMSIISVFVYIINKNIEYKMITLYLPGAFIGGIIGAVLLGKLKTKVVKNIFALMVIYAGIRMILK